MHLIGATLAKHQPAVPVSKQLARSTSGECDNDSESVPLYAVHYGRLRAADRVLGFNYQPATPAGEVQCGDLQ